MSVWFAERARKFTLRLSAKGGGIHADAAKMIEDAMEQVRNEALEEGAAVLAQYPERVANIPEAMAAIRALKRES